MKTINIPVTKNGLYGLGGVVVVILVLTAIVFFNGILERIKNLENNVSYLQSRHVPFDEIDMSATSSQIMFIELTRQSIGQLLLAEEMARKAQEEENRKP